MKGCVKWLEQKGIKLQAALLAAALNEEKRSKILRSWATEKRNEKEGKRGNILQYGLLVECESEYNTLVLPVKKKQTNKKKNPQKNPTETKTGGTYWVVQDLREVNKIVREIHLVVARMVYGIGFKWCILLSAFSQRKSEFICIWVGKSYHG